MNVTALSRMAGAAMAAVVLLAGTAVAQTPNTAWYTANPNAATFSISTADELAGLAELVNSGTKFTEKTIKLAGSINLSGYADWSPIGTEDRPFSGTFDGNGSIISGLSINRPEEQNIGLFGVAKNAEIKKVYVITESVVGGLTVGALVGSAVTVTIDSCRSSGYVSGSASVGGLAGNASGGTISFSSSDSECHATGSGGHNWSSVGGLVGNAGEITISDSYATGDVTGVRNNVGGLIGYAKYIIVNRCFSTGDVSGEGDIGGLMGNVNGSDTISNSYATGNVTGNGSSIISSDNIGGFAGHAPNITAVNSYSTGKVEFTDGYYTSAREHGFTPYSDRNGFSNCFWDIETSNQPQKGTNDNVTGKSTAEMKQRATFTDWDFENIWYIDEGKNYPRLIGVGPTVLRYTAGTGGRIIGSTTQIIVNLGENGTAVVALADAGYVFVEWSDGVKDSERIDKDVTSSIYVTAVFAPADPVVLTYSAGEGGTIRGQSAQTIPVGTDGSEVEAVPDSGYIFVSWSDDLKTARRTDRSVASDITVTAAFAKVYTLSYTAGAGGAIIGAVTQMVTPGANGSAVTAAANSGYMFVSWSDGVTTAERTDENVTADISVTANFAQIRYTLRYILGEGGRDIVGGTAEQAVLPGASGEEVYVTANTGYTFAHWSDGSLDNPRTDRNVRNDITVTAYFADSEGKVSVLADNRTIPVPPTEEAAVVAPAAASSGGFTAGPNIIRRGAHRASSVTIFHAGAAIGRPRSATDNVLTVYDASGNVVNKISLSDNAPVSPPSPQSPANNRRAVGQWDLRDAKNRPVPEGTYLLRGVVRAVDGSREKVSLKVSVR